LIKAEAVDALAPDSASSTGTRASTSIGDGLNVGAGDDQDYEMFEHIPALLDFIDGPIDLDMHTAVIRVDETVEAVLGALGETQRAKGSVSSRVNIAPAKRQKLHDVAWTRCNGRGLRLDALLSHLKVGRIVLLG